MVAQPLLARCSHPFPALFTLGQVCSRPDPPVAALKLCLCTSAPPTQCALPGTGLLSVPRACLGPIPGRTVLDWPVTGPFPAQAVHPEGARHPCESERGGPGLMPGAPRRIWEKTAGLGRGAGGRRHRQRVMEQGAGGPPGGRHLALPTPVQSRGGHKPRLKNIHA